VLSIVVGYLAVLTGAAWVATLARRHRPPASAGSRRMAVLIPAHDEAVVIGDTLAALAAVDYPSDRVDVHLVADHCTDATADIARAAGVTVHERDSAPRGKGPALTWAIGRILDGARPPEVVVIVDADTIVAPQLLQAIDTAVAGGAQAVQGQYRVRDPGSSTGAGLRAAALAARHHLRPLGRNALGASCGLYGNGMAFTADVLRDRSWSGHLTEDVEFQMELLDDGVLVRYAPDAIVEAEMPATLSGSVTQNRRWEQGRLDLARQHVPKLLGEVARPRSGKVPRVAALDAALDHVVPPLSVLVAATGGVAVASSAVSMLGGGGRRLAGWGLIALLVGHVASGLYLARVPASVYRSLVHAPRMVAWKVGLWARTLVRPDDAGWVRTAREGEER
jgi:hypothetical protein